MKQTIEKTWDLLDTTIKEIQKKNPEVFCNGTQESFDREFRKLYEYIKDNFMKDEVKNLDRHKVASIIIVSIIKMQVVGYKGNLPEDSKFFAPYVIAASVGITYMMDRLNLLLREKNLKQVDRLWFPDALSCDTEYIEIFSRNLYFANEISGWSLNPLDIAEKLFVLEYVTLEKNDIDPHVLKEE